MDKQINITEYYTTLKNIKLLPHTHTHTTWMNLLDNVEQNKLHTKTVYAVRLHFHKIKKHTKLLDDCRSQNSRYPERGSHLGEGTSNLG